ncbi:MAG: FAD-binding oxidoreductase [Spirochaetaceae bacterium]|nr:MAG: FAD-binding oxidoreductase [Spirochaetaceae bacterium]
MGSIERFCGERLRGSCDTDDKTLRRHSTDMSIYAITPLAVVRPEGRDDVPRLLRFCSDERIAVTPRAGASNTGGAAIGSGVVLVQPDVPTGAEESARFESHGDRLLIEVPAGMRHDRVQRLLNDRGYHLPSDPSSGPLSYIGANVATKASGAHALGDGAIDRYLHSVVAVLPDGRRIDTAVPDSLPAPIADGLLRIADGLRARSDLCERIRAVASRKSASGYNLAALVDAPDPDLARLFAGSVGTLGVIETVRLLCPRQESGSALLVIAFASEEAACDALPAVRDTDPAACEILDSFCTSILNGQGVDLPREAAALLVVEYAAVDPDAARDAVERARERLAGSATALSAEPMVAPDAQARFWKARKSMMLRLRGLGRERAALSVVNDVGVPVERLSAFWREARSIFDRLDIPAPIYGHAADGNLHLRPLFDATDPDLRQTVRAVADRIYGLVLSIGGTITGEHGMGRLRSPFLRREWGDELHSVMLQLNRLFDPHEIMNHDAMFYEGDLLAYFNPPSGSSEPSGP